MPDIPVTKQAPGEVQNIQREAAQTTPLPSPIPVGPQDSPQVQNNPIGGEPSPTIMDAVPAPGQMGPPEPVPPTSDEGDKAGAIIKQQADDQDAAIQQKLNALRTRAPSEAVPKPPAAEESHGIGFDLLTGAMEWPTQVWLGGPRDAAQAMINLSAHLASHVDAIHKWQEANGGIEASTPKLPEVPAAKSASAGFARGVSKFLVGMMGPGKIAKAGAEAAALPATLASMAQGAAASFSVFNGHDSRLSDLVQKYPLLRNPVTQYLASNPNDSELEGRFKGALEGELPGVLVNGLIGALKAVKFGRIMNGLENIAKEKMGEPVKPAPVERTTGFATLGDPEQPLFSDKMSKAASATEAQAAEGAGAFPPGHNSGTEINWARIDSADDIKNVMQKMANAHAADVSEAARGTRSFEETKLAAGQIDAWNTLMNRRVGQPLNAEESVAARNLWAASAKKLNDVAQAASEAPTDANLFAFRKQLATHYAIQNEVIAARTETARALGSWKIPVGDAQMVGGEIGRAISDAGGRDLSMTMAKKMADMMAAGKYSQLENLIQKTPFEKAKDAFTQYWFSALLSGPQTHVANAASNYTAAIQQIQERKVAELISQKLGTEGGVAIGEAAAMMHVFNQHTMDMLRTVGNVVKNPSEGAGALRDFALSEKLPASTIPGQKLEVGRGGAFSADTWNLTQGSASAKVMNSIEVATRLPGRMLSASDNYFKGLNYQMELAAQAVRKVTADANGAVMEPGAVREKVAALVSSPTKEMHEAAVQAAEYATFTQDPSQMLSRIAGAIQNWKVGPFAFGRMLLPFKNTPINVMTYGLERTPLAPLVGQWMQDFAAGGARRDIALAKWSTANAMFSLGMDLAHSGILTGSGPTERGHKMNFRARGGQPYSINVGGKSISFSRNDIIGMPLGLAADTADAIINAGNDISDRDIAKVMAASVFSIVNKVTTAQFMTGTSRFMEALSDPNSKALRYIELNAGSLIPSAVASGARVVDPHMKNAYGMLETLKSRIPFWSKDVPDYHDLFGRTVDYRSPMGWGYDMFSPFYIKKENPEPVDSELNRLTYYPDVPDDKVVFHDLQGHTAVVKLDQKQFSRYMELAGNGAKAYNGLGLKDFLNETIQGKGPYGQMYKQVLSDGREGGKAQFIQNWINKYRNIAKQQMLKESPEIAMKVKDRARPFASRINLQ